MSISFKNIQLLFIVSLLYTTGFAQNISSPYSIAGVGDLEDSYFNRSSGMANTSLALRAGRIVYQANPASYSALDNQFFTFELATEAKTVRYTGDPIPGGGSNSDIAIKKIAAGFKITPRLGTSIGFTPFSTVNYTFDIKNDLEGVKNIDGNGGINQLYLGNAYRITKNLSIGINAAYLFGSIAQNETQIDNTSQSVILTNSDIYYRKLNLTYGLQYFSSLNKKTDYGFGVTFSPENTLKGEQTISVISSTTNPLNGSQGSELVSSEVTDNHNFLLPAAFGLGMSVTRNKSLTFAADYKYQNWSASNYKSANATLTNSHRISIGADFSKLRTINGLVYERYNLQAGFYLNNSYLQWNGKQINEFGISIGGGIPVSGRININAALEGGNRGTSNNGLIKENYLQLTLNISYRDFWYTKGRKYD